MINEIIPECMDYVFKYVIIGDTSVGKSCIMHNFIYERFRRETTQTIGVEFSSKIINLSEKKIKLQIWDTAGQERYQSVAKTYYRNSIGVIIVFDTTRIDTFNHVQNWLNDAKNLSREEASFCVVGNKCDLKDNRVVKFNDVAKFCQNNNLLHIECSALNGENINEIFFSLSKQILGKIDSGRIDGMTLTSGIIAPNNRLRKDSTEEVEKKIENERKCLYC